MNKHQNFSRMLFVVFLLGLNNLGCSGGGGGSEGGGDSGVKSSESGNSTAGALTRGTDSAIRILHGEIDETPVSLFIGDQLIQTARYAEQTFYQRVALGSQLLRVERANLPGEIVKQIPEQVEKNQEMSLLLYGKTSTGEPQIVLFRDNSERPEQGKVFIRFVNALSNNFKAKIAVDGFSSETLLPSEQSTTITTASGTKEINFYSGSSQLLVTESIAIPDQGEATVVLSGDPTIGMYTIRTYLDLD
jgi:hypothetical protein